MELLIEESHWKGDLAHFQVSVTWLWLERRFPELSSRRASIIFSFHLFLPPIRVIMPRPQPPPSPTSVVEALVRRLGSSEEQDDPV